MIFTGESQRRCLFGSELNDAYVVPATDNIWDPNYRYGVLRAVHVLWGAFRRHDERFDRDKLFGSNIVSIFRNTGWRGGKTLTCSDNANELWSLVELMKSMKMIKKDKINKQQYSCFYFVHSSFFLSFSVIITKENWLIWMWLCVQQKVSRAILWRTYHRGNAIG